MVKSFPDPSSPPPGWASSDDGDLPQWWSNRGALPYERKTWWAGVIVWAVGTLIACACVLSSRRWRSGWADTFERWHYFSIEAANSYTTAKDYQSWVWAQRSAIISIHNIKFYLPRRNVCHRIEYPITFVCVCIGMLSNSITAIVCGASIHVYSHLELAWCRSVWNP